MGLALYDKTQEYVGETKTAIQVESTSDRIGKQSEIRPIPVEHPMAKTQQRSRPTKDLITAAFKVLEAQNKITKEEFKSKYQKGKGLSTLTDGEMNDILKTVKQDFNL